LMGCPASRGTSSDIGRTARSYKPCWIESEVVGAAVVFEVTDCTVNA